MFLCFVGADPQQSVLSLALDQKLELRAPLFKLRPISGALCGDHSDSPASTTFVSNLGFMTPPNHPAQLMLLEGFPGLASCPHCAPVLQAKAWEEPLLP